MTGPVAAAARLADVGTPPLLVLGASEDQVPIYREARRRGLPTIAVDYWLDRPGRPLANVFLHISTRDHESVAAAIGDIPLAGVVSGASDASLRSWHELSRRYGVPYLFPLPAALASLDKALFREVVRAVGLPAYGWVEARDPIRALTESERLRFPVVTKPVDGSGSKGITLVAERAELAAALAWASAHSLSGGVIVEEYVEGRHVTVEVFLRRGRAHFAATTERTLRPGPRLLVDGYRCPAPLPDATTSRLVRTAETLCAAIGLTDGPANLDFVIAPDDTHYVIEINARLAGNGYPRVMRAVYGVDTARALVALALGEPFDLSPTRRRCALLTVLTSPVDREGELVGIDGLAEVAAMPGVVDLEVFARPGGVVKPYTQAGHKLGYLVVTGRTHAEAQQTTDRARQALVVTVADAPPAPR